MARRVEIGETKTHLPVLLVKVGAGEHLVICRDAMSIAHVRRIAEADEHAAPVATLRRERTKQNAATTAEILSWHRERHVTGAHIVTRP